ncbi:hypothetical protein BJP34_35665 (plasmid) [Moorena producens PAL-8-15-08-1]|uniref:Uncharacterized protein n=1 Tax=Moorena producens PAL-8-15-08-1 TaxID=1458985 RepID=A0A1D8U497_9CYAN|nr:hypothetical protein [Moorena producens]AOX04720.1 hypothetical protein BJP34_35665 [Moorena producens PAL-8-15-08-1]
MAINNSEFSFEITLNPILVAFIFGGGAATATLLAFQNTIIDNQQLNNKQVQTQIVDCPLVEQLHNSENSPN